MTKESLMKAGMTEEQADKIMEELESDYVTKSRFNEVNTELKTARADIKNRDGQIATLKKDHQDNEVLQQQITQLQADNAQKDKDHAAEINQIRIGNAVDRALMDAKAINPTAVKPFLAAFLEKAQLADDGTITGLADEINKLATTDGTSFLFHSTETVPTISGAAPTSTGAGSPTPGKSFDQMTYSEMVAYQAAHPDAKF